MSGIANQLLEWLKKSDKPGMGQMDGGEIVLSASEEPIEGKPVDSEEIEKLLKLMEQTDDPKKKEKLKKRIEQLREEQANVPIDITGGE